MPFGYTIYSHAHQIKINIRSRKHGNMHLHTTHTYAHGTDSLSVILVDRWKLANSIKHFIIVCPIICIHSLIRPVRSVSVHLIFFNSFSLSLFHSRSHAFSLKTGCSFHLVNNFHCRKLDICTSKLDRIRAGRNELYTLSNVRTFIRVSLN